MHLLLSTITIAFVFLARHSTKALPIRRSIKRTSIRGIKTTFSMSSGVDENNAGYRIEKAGGDWETFSEQMHQTMDKCLARVEKFRRYLRIHMTICFIH